MNELKNYEIHILIINILYLVITGLQNLLYKIIIV